MVALYLGIDSNEVFEGVLDDPVHVTLLESFCKPDGRFAIMFYYQDGDPPPIGCPQSGRPIANAPKDVQPQVKRVYVTDGSTIRLEGKAIVVYRTNSDKAIEQRNVTDDVSYAEFNIKEMGNAVAVVCNLINMLLRPTVEITKEWGDLNKTQEGQEIKKQFMGDFESFVDFLDTTKIDLEGVVRFAVNKEMYEKYLSNIVHVKQTATNSELVAQLQADVRVWAKQMEKVGFAACLADIRIKSKLIRVLLGVDAISTTEAGERIRRTDSRDRILAETVGQVHQHRGVYQFGCVQEPPAVFELGQVENYEGAYIHMIGSVRHPATPGQPAVHHQDDLHDVALLQQHGERHRHPRQGHQSDDSELPKVFELRRQEDCLGAVPFRSAEEDSGTFVQVCLDLYLKYYQCFKQTQRTMAEVGENPFECSEMYVFGKFETFKKRVEQIVDVLETTTKYSILQSSKIENIDNFASKFQQYYKKISSKTYDALNHRLDMFDKDYVEFKQNVADTEWELEEFVGTSLEKMTDVDNVLRLLNRYVIKFPSVVVVACNKISYSLM
ncbi:male fertility factor kl5 [Holotrichia oblita]|uniref:Male fertility factor kl5 n=1 Tax=Holotrichia oblita TaxID=644536 RepID=A0ACB9TR98_HOLOL|nr:male fertility factor kl5 [Holotrichia oblita]